jgi:hypothetical protein
VTDFLSLCIWIVLSSLIGQIGNETNGEGPDGQDEQVANNTGLENASGGSVAAGIGADAYEPIVQIIKICIAAFSVLLLGLSLSAYRKTALKSIIYAAAAFGLFAAQLLFDYLEDAVQGWEQPYNDVIFYAMTLAILALFFLAIARRK